MRRPDPTCCFSFKSLSEPIPARGNNILAAYLRQQTNCHARLSVVVTVLFAAVFSLSSGCTSYSLRRHTVAQTQTWNDIQYRQIIENLAMVAANPDVLPSYSTQDYGTADVSDTVGLIGVSQISPRGTAGTGSLDPSVKRSVKHNWTLAQVSAPEKLRALRLAFRYAVFNDPALLTLHDHDVSLDAFCYPHGACNNSGADCVAKPGPNCSRDYPCDCDYPGQPGYYFNVKSDLEQIPPGWLHVGQKCAAARHARFSAQCGTICVWVCERDMAAFTQFTLVIQRIVRQVVPQTYQPHPIQMAITPGANDVAIVTNCATSHAASLRIAAITVPVDCYGNVVIVKDRLDSVVFSDQKLKSSLSAAIKSP